ncbi:metal-sensitive transcriptional regulator [Acidobacterium sp. S8]|uniref:metal-sensitive transcriptional regulator n=1 Tax=Acidobacterium sp. S8 TaxID=1641854 RepID=UPI00131C0291|nr:metal-sensitive transcriptional regulator [Acidobacterium sp. S8]
MSAKKMTAVNCACGDERKAASVDPEIKAATLRRLARIAGQIRGLEKMVEQERYCADILVQISSVQEALRGTSRHLMRNHLQHCATDAIKKGSESAEAMYDELLDLVYKHSR